MNPEQVKEQEDLTLAVRALIEEVKQLNERMTFFAPRDEVKRDGRRRAFQFLAYAIAVVMLAQVLTMTTISYCFLNVAGERKQACTVMPGYGEAFQQNAIRNDRFVLLLDGIEGNDARVTNLEKRIAELEKK